MTPYQLSLELQSSLGSRLVEHIRHLNRRSNSEDVAEALRRAFCETRSTPSGFDTAEQLWADFLTQLDGSVDHVADFQDLKSAWADALNWKERLDSGAEIHRQDMKGDLMTFSDCIRDLIIELEG